jgi:hypothetical protein
MASQPAGGKKKPPPGATTQGRASTTPGGATQRTPGPGAIELSAAMQTSLTSDAARRGNTPAPHFDRPPESRMMTPGMLSLAGDDSSDDGRSKTMEDITPLPMTFAQLSRTSPRPEGVTYRNQPLPNTPADLYSAADQGQASATRTTDSSARVQPVGATSITRADVQSLMQIQSRQFQQSIVDSIDRVQANMGTITQELRSDQTNTLHTLRQPLRRETEQATQSQGQSMLAQGQTMAELSRMLRKEVLPTLRARNVQVALPATPTQTLPQDQQPTTQANVVPATPAQLPTDQQQPTTPDQGLLANTVYHRDPYESIMA